MFVFSQKKKTATTKAEQLQLLVQEREKRDLLKTEA